MIAALLACTALLASEPENPPPIADHTAYEAARARAGRDPDAQVRLALWCEAHGLSAERVRHLALAVLNDPSHATARGLLGLVPYAGRWQTPEAVAERVKADEERSAAMAEYARRRARIPNTADAHWKLALWCQHNGLEPEAKAHLAIVVQLDPSREAAWKQLGYRKQKHRWVSDEQLAAEKAEADAQKAADKQYVPSLAKYRAWLDGRDPGRKAQANEALAALTDPRAVPAVWQTFAAGNAAQQAIAIRVLGQIDSPGSNRALAILAVMSPSAELRGQATNILQRRDPRDFVGMLIGMLRDPVTYEVRRVGGPGSPGALFVNGKEFNVQFLYSPPPMPDIPLYAGEPINLDADGLPVISRYLGPSTFTTQSFSFEVTGAQFVGKAPLDPDRQRVVAEARNQPIGGLGWLPELLTDRRPRVQISQTTSIPLESTVQIPIGQLTLEYQRSALVAQEQLKEDVRRIDSFNVELRESNQRVQQVLTAVTGRASGGTQEDWKAWWVDFLGYSYTRPPEGPRPTLVEEVPLAYTPQPVPVVSQVSQTGPPVRTLQVATSSFSCFQAGTPVRTLTGDRPIETIAAGDQVLVQDTTTGRLGFQPVVGVFHNKPSRLLKIRLGDETIGATPIHRFWRAGVGWTMARDLKPGDAVRGLGGPVRVESVEPGSVQPVYNLMVAEGKSFFVGRQRLLVHDNSLVQPALKPFDAAPDLAAITGPSASGRP